MESQEKIDSLHQKASAHYLQGEFDRALQAWRELLALDPQDDRANEGVKLCELLAEDETDEAGPEAAPSFSVEGFDDDLDELDAILDGKQKEGFDFAFSDPGEQALDQPPDPPADGAELQAGGIDFGNLPDAEQQEIQFGVDPRSLDLPQGGGEAESADPAAAELRHRVRELMAEAEADLAKGDKNGALSALNRIAILDENNTQAQALRERIEEGEAEPEEVARPDPPELDLQIPDEPAPAAEEPVAAAAEVAEVPFEDEAVPAVAESEPSVEIAVGMAKPSLRDRLNGMKLLVAGGVLAVIAIGGFSAYWFLWGPGAEGRGEDSGEATVAAAGAAVLPQLPEPPGEAEPVARRQQAEKRSQPDEKPAEQAVDLAVLLAQADKAFERGDYRDAVLAYNKVLEVDPDNRPASAQLAIAGERFRAQKELEEKRGEAIEAFERGNYRSALTIFYRMPESEDQKRLDRYKLNGWYNMGLQALSMGDCNSAGTHLKEAQAIDSSDKEVIIALDLARICRYSRGDSAYQEEVRQLTYRALED